MSRSTLKVIDGGPESAQAASPLSLARQGVADALRRSAAAAEALATETNRANKVHTAIQERQAALAEIAQAQAATGLDDKIRAWIDGGCVGEVPEISLEAATARSDAQVNAAGIESQIAALNGQLPTLQEAVSNANARVQGADKMLAMALRDVLLEEAVRVGLELDAADANRRAVAAKLAGLRGVLMKNRDSAGFAENIRQRLDRDLTLELDPSRTAIDAMVSAWMSFGERLITDPATKGV